MKKLFTVFLILALVLSFFVACDSDSGSGGGGGKKTPGDEEKGAVWELSGIAGEITLLTLEEYDDDHINYKANIQTFLNTHPLEGVYLDCQSATSVTPSGDNLNLNLAFKSKGTNDYLLSCSGIVTDPASLTRKYNFDMTTSVSSEIAGKAYNLSAKGVLSDESVKFTKVVLNGVEYEPSAFDTYFN